MGGRAAKNILPDKCMMKRDELKTRQVDKMAGNDTPQDECNRVKGLVRKITEVVSKSMKCLKRKLVSAKLRDLNRSAAAGPNCGTNYFLQ